MARKMEEMKRHTGDGVQDWTFPRDKEARDQGSARPSSVALIHSRDATANARARDARVKPMAQPKAKEER